MHAEVLKNQYYLYYQSGKLKIQLILITRTPTNSKCFLFLFRV